MYQQITMIGNLGSDPEMRYTPSGVAVASFSLAVNRSWTGQDGQRQDKTTWFRINVWNKQAETVTQYCSKGKQVMVVGEVEEARVYVDRDGNPRASLEVKAQSVRFLGQRGDGVEIAEETTYQKKAPSGSSKGFDPDEDIPF